MRGMTMRCADAKWLKLPSDIPLQKEQGCSSCIGPRKVYGILQYRTCTTQRASTDCSIQLSRAENCVISFSISWHRYRVPWCQSRTLDFQGEGVAGSPVVSAPARPSPVRRSRTRPQAVTPHVHVSRRSPDHLERRAWWSRVPLMLESFSPHMLCGIKWAAREPSCRPEVGHGSHTARALHPALRMT